MSDFKSNVLAAHEMNKLPYWKIYKGASATGNPIFVSDEQSDFDQAHSRLIAALNLIQVAGKYLIQFKEKLTSNNNNISYEFEVPYGISTSGGQLPAVGGLQPSGMISKTEIVELIAAEKKKWEQEQENKEMRKQLAELNVKIGKLSKQASPWADAFETFKPHLPLLMGVVQKWAGGGAQVGIAGIGDQQVPEYNRQQQPAQTEPVTQTEPPVVDDNQQVQTSAADTELQNNNKRLQEVMIWLIEVKGGNQTEAVNLLYRMMEKGKANPSLIPMLEGFL